MTANKGGRYIASSLGFWTQPDLRRVLCAAGIKPVFALPRVGDHILTWGGRKTAARARQMARRSGAQQLFIEDAFLRGLHPRKGIPLGLLIDSQGQHFDPQTPTDLEDMLAQDPLDDPHLLARADAAIARMKALHSTKYSAVDPELALPDAGYVLVVDQVPGDASLVASGAGPAEFAQMLAQARADHPGKDIVIKGHPAAGRGHYSTRDADVFITGPASPWAVFDRAVAVYTISSTMGFEAILAGHRPHVFGGPFYAGWGLTKDYADLPRRGRSLTPAQLFAAAMIKAPFWYDPYHHQACELECVLDTLEAQTRAWREDRRGWVAAHMRLWKRAPLRKFVHGPLSFAPTIAQAHKAAAKTGARVMTWGAHDAPGVVQIEDGFLRSNGLGAALTPPMSLVFDQTGLYYDPNTPSDLHQAIAASGDLPPAALARAEALRQRIITSGVTKYNLTDGDLKIPSAPEQTVILVPGQVADDASVRLGAPGLGNLDLLTRVRQENPDAFVVYKPHPDVEAGLRSGAIPHDDMLRLADCVAMRVSAEALLRQADQLWTLSSTMGFEALLRGIPVTCLGQPFYAGWGLTQDLAPAVIGRRPSGITLAGLVHAVLIDYPRYVDPITGLACPPEIVVDRLAAGDFVPRGTIARIAAKGQGVLASLGLWDYLRPKG